MARDVSPDDVDRIAEALYSGHKIDAIKIYRGATDAGLAEAKDAVEQIESRLRAETPEKFTAASSPPFAGLVIALVVIAAIIAAAALLLRAATPDAARPDATAASNSDGTHHAPAEQRRPTLSRAPVVDDLSGRWLLSLPAGFQHRLEIARVDATHYRLGGKHLTMTGLYELRGGKLVITTPDTTPDQVGYEWKIDTSDKLVLVAQPPVGKKTGNYKGATLTRMDDSQ